MKDLSALKKGLARLQNELDIIVTSPEDWIQEFDHEPSQHLGLIALLVAESEAGTKLRNDAEVDQRLQRVIESGSDQEAFAAAITYLGRDVPDLDPVIRMRFCATQQAKLKVVLAGVAASQSSEATKDWLREEVLPHATDDIRTMIQAWTQTDFT